MLSHSSLHSSTSVDPGGSQQPKRWDTEFHAFVYRVVTSQLFNVVIMVTILLNTVTIALETTSLSTTHALLFTATDNIFLGIYLLEFALKVYAEPVGYWHNYYNLFDFTVLVISVVQNILAAVRFGQTGLTVLRVVRAVRALRTLRSISFIRGLQVLVTALLHTFRSSVLYLLLLLLILMFLFAIMGYYFFGYDESGDQQNWGNFGIAMLSLFNFVTADGWTDLQDQLSSHGLRGSEFFTISFLFLGHFIFTNLFIGVIIMNIHSATQEFENAKRAEKEAFIQNKKEAMIQRQHEDVMQVLEKQRASNFTNFQEMTQEFQKTLRHDDFMYTTDLCTNLAWMETMIASLLHLQNNKYRIQQLQFEIAETLAQLKEIQLQKECAP